MIKSQGLSVKEFPKLYTKILMEHYHTPLRRGVITEPHYKGEAINTSCGDRVVFFFRLNDDVISEIAFEGKGCIISQAFASILADFAVGKRRELVENLTSEELCAMGGLELGPNRMLCVAVSLDALRKAFSHA